MVCQIRAGRCADRRCKNRFLDQGRLDHRLGQRIEIVASVALIPARLWQRVALAFKRIRWQFHLATPIVAIYAGPVYVRPTQVQRGQTLQHLLPITALAAQAWQPICVWQLNRLAAQAQERGMRPDFEKDIAPFSFERCHSGCEAHRISHMPYPAHRIGEFVPGGFAGGVGDQLDSRRVQSAPTGPRAQSRPAWVP